MKTPVAKWVPRKSLSRKPKSAEAMELDKEEKAWQHQLYRARQAKERAEVRQALKDRQREIERANELEERSGERKRKFDVDACREKRAQAEAQVLLDEKRAAQDEILRLTLVASADAAGMDAVAFKAQQEGISLLEAEKAIEEENKSRPATTEGQIVTVEEEFEAEDKQFMALWVWDPATVELREEVELAALKIGDNQKNREMLFDVWPDDFDGNFAEGSGKFPETIDDAAMDELAKELEGLL